jgi:hypothetical protein
VARVSDMVFDNVGDDLDGLAEYMVTQIDSINADVILFQSLVRQLQSQSFNSMVLLGQYRRGDKSAYATLFETDPQWKELDNADGKLTIMEIQAIETRLLY